MPAQHCTNSDKSIYLLNQQTFLFQPYELSHPNDHEVLTLLTHQICPDFIEGLEKSVLFLGA